MQPFTPIYFVRQDAMAQPHGQYVLAPSVSGQPQLAVAPVQGIGMAPMMMQPQPQPAPALPHYIFSAAAPQVLQVPQTDSGGAQAGAVRLVPSLHPMQAPHDAYAMAIPVSEASTGTQLRPELVPEVPSESVRTSALGRAKVTAGVATRVPVVQGAAPTRTQDESEPQPRASSSSTPPPRASSSNPPGTEATMRLRDPLASDDVVYDVPLAKLLHTRGLTALGNAGPAGSRRHPTLCVAFAERKCHMDVQCKSIHVDQACLDQLRAEHGVTGDRTLLREIPIRDEAGQVKSVRYGWAWKSEGLSKIRNDWTAGREMQPGKLCAAFTKHGRCPEKQTCSSVHVRGSSRLVNSMHTPCCVFHGDDAVLRGKQLAVDACMTVRLGDGHSHDTSLSLRRVAITAGLATAIGDGSGAALEVSINDLCPMHIASRCEPGRVCPRVHVCRQWAASVGIAAGRTPSSPQADSLERPRLTFTAPRS